LEAELSTDAIEDSLAREKELLELMNKMEGQKKD
jgi:hypothetical protein